MPDADVIEQGGESKAAPMASRENGKPAAFESGSRTERASRNSIASGNKSPNKRIKRASINRKSAGAAKRSSWLTVLDAVQEGSLKLTADALLDREP